VLAGPPAFETLDPARKRRQLRLESLHSRILIYHSRILDY
jgi:hypothetical protein